MKCARFKRAIPEYVDGVLIDQVARDLECHMAACERCRTECERQKDIVSMLDRGIEALATAAWVPEDLESNVIRRLRVEQERSALVHRLFGWFDLRPVMAYGALFVVFTASFTILMHYALPVKDSQVVEVRSGHRYAFTTRPSVDGKVQARHSTRRYARIESPVAGWQR